MSDETKSARTGKRAAASARGMLEQRGDEVVVQLIAENLGNFCESGEACRLGGLSTGRLRRARLCGSVICYRGKHHGRYIYPKEQFGSRSVKPWAREIVQVVGNGAAALHFLLVRRRSLKGSSIGTILRHAEVRSATGIVRQYLRKVAAE